MDKEYTKQDIKKMLERIWDATYEKEVGLRVILLQEAEREGITLNRKLKKRTK